MNILTQEQTQTLHDLDSATSFDLNAVAFAVKSLPLAFQIRLAVRWGELITSLMADCGYITDFENPEQAELVKTIEHLVLEKLCPGASTLPKQFVNQLLTEASTALRGYPLAVVGEAA